MTEKVTHLTRQPETKALLSTDNKALEEYKLKKKMVRDINTLKEQVSSLISERDEMKERLAHIEAMLNKG